MNEPASFQRRTAPDHPGWSKWQLTDDSLFNTQVMGDLLVRQEGERAVRLRMLNTERRHGNLHENVHGGVILALADIAMFAAIAQETGNDLANSVTLDLNCQFIGSARIGEPIDAVAEILRETRRLVFARGLVQQGDALVASFSGTLRKPAIQ